MNNQYAGESLAASMSELCSRFSFRQILVATIVARWKRRRAVNNIDAFPSWLRRDLALSDE
ncbi:hypothetical protein [Rhizobiales bacterium]